MTRKSFYRKLRKVADQFTWKVHSNGTLRAKKGRITYCPITAVVEASYNEYYRENEYDCASYEHLNIDFYEASKIARAADANVEYLYGEDKLIRRALLRAVFGNE